MRAIWQDKRIDLYIAAVIVPSIILAALAIWALIRQYNLINYSLQMGQLAGLNKGEMFGAFSWVSIFAFAMIILALLVILIIGSYLSAHDVQRQLEVAKLKNDFVSTVSHELKTPLTSIRLLTERSLKLAPGEDLKRREYLNLILVQSYQLSHLIGNILDFSKLEQEGKEKYKLEKTDLAELVRRSVQDYPTEMIRPDCKLNVDKIASALPLIFLDKQAISRAFVNLLDNALKFSPSGGIVKIRVGQAGPEAFVEVADHGPGIEEEEKTKIFQRFYHCGKGTGLGLTLAQHIVEGHNGRIELVSEKGSGSTFRILLPLEKRRGMRP